MGIPSSVTSHVDTGSMSNIGAAKPLTAGDQVTGAMLMKALEEVGRAMANAELSTMTLLTDKSEYQNNAGTAFNNIAGQEVTDAMNALNNFIAYLAQEAAASSSSGIFGWIVAAVCTVLAVITCQPALAVVSLTMLALQQSGGMTAMVKGLGGLLGSQVAAELLITLVITAVSGGVSSVASGSEAVAEEAAETAAEEAPEEAASSAASDTASNAGTEAEEEQQSLLQRLAQKLPFRNVPKPVAIAIIAGTSAAQSSGLVSTAVTDLVQELPISKKAKEALEITLTVLISIMMAIAAAGATTGLASSTQSSLFDMAASKGWLTSARAAQASGAFFKVSGYLGSTAMLGEAASQGAVGGIGLKEASAIKDQGASQAITTFFETILGVMNAQASATSSSLSSVLQQEGKEMAAACQGGSLVNLAAARDLCA